METQTVQTEQIGWGKFLRDVAVCALGAYGGPEAHYGRVHRPDGDQAAVSDGGGADGADRAHRHPAGAEQHADDRRDRLQGRRPAARAADISRLGAARADCDDGDVVCLSLAGTRTAVAVPSALCRADGGGVYAHRGLAGWAKGGHKLAHRRALSRQRGYHILLSYCLDFLRGLDRRGLGQHCVFQRKGHLESLPHPSAVGGI